MNKKVYVHIEVWCNRQLTGEYPYVYLDGIWLKRNWGGDYQNVSILVTIAVDQDGFREIRRRTRVVGSFPGGHSALMLVCTRLRYVASSN
jgi:transposase-like protein